MKVAMIGSGGIAQRHLGVLATIPEVEIVAHASPTAANVEASATRWGGRAYTSHEELLLREEPDAVWITVPPGAHGSIERALITRRIPFFVEKPLAASRELAEEIGRALVHSGVIAGVGYHWRAMDTLDEVKTIISENPVRMVQGAWLDATPPPAWWRSQASSGGQMVEQATHLIDLARALLGEASLIAASSVHCERPDYPDFDVAAVSAAMLRFAGGVPGLFSASSLLRGPAAIELQLICEGMLITLTQRGVVFDSGRDRRQLPLQGDPIAIEDRAFIEAVRLGDPALLFSSYADALHTHRLCFDILEATG